MAKQILGKVVPIVKGTYNSSTQYAILDIVEYNGSSYIAKTNVQGQAPTNTTYWQLLAKQGDKPVYKVDYLTNAEMAEIVNDIITDSTNTFNQNVTAKTTAFNNNATDKTSAFNSNATSKTGDFNSNATSKTTAFNNNAIDKTSDYNTNASSTKDDFDRNASSKTTTFNDNATSKTNSYNSNATDKTTAYNNNHTDKLGAYNDNASAKTTAFNNNASEKTTEFNANAEALQEEVDRYKTLENAMPHVTNTGENITLSDTANSPLWLELEPTELSQATTTGKNKCNILSAGGNCSYSNGTITSDARDSNSLFYVNITPIQINVGDTLYVTMKIKLLSGTSSNINYGGRLSDSGNTYSLISNETYPSSITNSYQIYCFKNAVSENMTANRLYFQTGTGASSAVYEVTDIIVSTTKDDTYEPYTGNAPSPSPDYPQDIHVISGDNEISVVGKNKLNKDNGRFGYYGSDGNWNPANNNVTFDMIPVVPNTTYTFSTNAITDGKGISEFDKNKTFIQRASTTYNSSTKTITTTANTYYISPVMNVNNQAISQSTIDSLLPQLELGSSATTYVPHQEQTSDLELDDIEYCKIGDYKDRFFKNIPSDVDYDETRELGKWYLKKNIGKVVLDGSEDGWSIANSGTANWYYQIALSLSLPTASQTNQLCNYYANGQIFNGNTTQGIMLLTNGEAIRIRYGEQDTITNYKAWLETHNVVLYFEKTTPTYTLLNETLQAQLETIYNKLLGYQDQTNISQVNNDLPFNIKAKAVYNLNKLVERVTTLENE